MIYLDYAATTPIDPRVLDTMQPHLEETWGNPSSPHAKGREARSAIDAARQQTADLLGVRVHEVVYVSSGSEGNALALFGTCAHWEQEHGKPGHIVTASVEHSCSLKATDRLEKRGWRVTRLPVDGHGRVQTADLQNALTDDTALVSLQWANNEVGTVQPVAEVSEHCRKAGVPFHCDAVQGIGLLPLPSPLPDMVTIAAHKFYGPRGIGTLIVRNDVQLTPQIPGGGQEFGLRAGTENTPAIAGMAEALRIALEEQAGEAQRLCSLRNRLEEHLLQRDDISLNGHPEERLPNFLNVRVHGHSAENLVIRLDMAGICVSSGAACVTGSVEPSHVLQAMGRTAGEATENLRITLGRQTTEADIERFIDVFGGILDS